MIALMILFPIIDDDIVDIYDIRKTAQKIAGETYVLPFHQKDLIEGAHQAIIERHPISEKFDLLSMEQFMNMVNDEDFIQENYYISHIYITFKI
jgi:hypothetical protein